MYAMVETWVDIAFAISMVSRFAKNPEPDYFSAVDQILRYLASSLEKGITFEGESKLNLVGYYDGMKSACLGASRWQVVGRQVVEEVGGKWENTKECINREAVSCI